MDKQFEVKEIGNYYGGLTVKECDGKFFWGIENWDGHNWSEITESLYKELLNFKEEKQ